MRYTRILEQIVKRTQLHQARLSLISERGLIGARATIADHNAPSIEPVLSQGFHWVKSELNENGISVGRYQIDLPDKQPAPNVEPE